MSAIITGRVLWTQFPGLFYKDKNGKQINIKPQTAKGVMVAISDSADDFGENSYQSFETIATKASIERRSAVRVVRSLIGAGYLKVAGVSPFGTNNFSITLDKLGYPPVKRMKMGRPKTSDVESLLLETGDSEAETRDSESKTRDSESKTGDSPSPDPSLSPPTPPLSPVEVEQVNKFVNFILENDRNPRKYTNREKMPAPYLPYCDFYVSLVGKDKDGEFIQVPTKRVLHEWMHAFEEWKQERLQPEHLRAAWEYANGERGFPVSGPHALTKTAVAMKTKLITQSKPAVNYSSVEQTRQEVEEKNSGTFVPRPADVKAPSIVRAEMRDLAKNRSNKNVLSQP